MEFTLNQLNHKFNQAITWNTILYSSHKLGATLISWLLWYQLPTSFFTAWGMIQALVFLSLLWVDGGLRKSIPRYAPLFMTNKATLRRFMALIISLHSLVILISCPITLIISSYLFPATISYEYYVPMGLLYIAEGLLGTTMLLYHAHFRHKEFNKRWSLLLFGQLCLSLLAMSLIHNPYWLICSLLATKAGAALGMALYSLYTLDDQAIMHYTNQPPPRLREFMHHSLIMWVFLILKSLSERNFLLPVVLAVAGPEKANLFKVAQDGALFFQRTVIKTIGSSGTSLFARALAQKNEKKLIEQLFEIIIAKLSELCIPLLGIIIFFMVETHTQSALNYGMLIFLIMVITYLIEIMVMPYETILEVTQQYYALIISYIPYILMLTYLFFLADITSIGLIRFIIMLYGVRLVSVLLRGAFARRSYALSFPFAFFIKRSFVVMLALCMLHYIYHFFIKFL